jgi:nucleoside-diphosphate kinase
MGRTLVICKPDAVERGCVGEIVTRLERKGLALTGGQLRTIDRDTAEELYETHRGKPFFDKLIAFMTRGPSVVLVAEGPSETWRVVRTVVGATDPVVAAPGTVRGDLALDATENLVHGSDGADAAEREINIFFPNL